MKNCLLTVLSLLFLPLLLMAQKNGAFVKGLRPLTEVPQVVIPPLDNDLLLAEEMARRGPGIPPRFAESMEVNINTNTHGIWESADNGDEVWRLRIFSAGAKSLNLGFSTYQMPRGGSLILYAPKRKNILGPFTPADNEEHDQLWTPVVDGEELIIEVQVPAIEKSNLDLQLQFVNHDFLGFTQMSLLSGSCNLDVICGESDGWGIVDQYRDIIRSVSMYSINGTAACTGFLINNANNDCTPFFMTANHCGVNNGNAASIVTYWNYESPICREPGSAASGGNGNGSLLDFNTGALHRASYGPSDVTLLELDDAVSESANPFFAGYSAEFVIPQDTLICIHHPSTDEKRITFEFDPADPSNDNGNVVNINVANHLRIPGWDIGTTEGGSSGSPLFNKSKQVVGQLHGGAASCFNANDNDSSNDWDYFGWFYTSWNGGGTPNTALRFWLDPNETGISTMSGRDCSYSITASPATQELCSPEDAVYNISTAPNFANAVTLSVVNLPTSATATFSVNPVNPGQSSILTITTNGVSSGLYNLEILATDGINEGDVFVDLNLVGTTPNPPALNIPNNNATNQGLNPSFLWNALGAGITYQFQLATDVIFSNIITMANNLDNNAFVNNTSLEDNTTYYWRVRASNACGTGVWSAIWSFTTADLDCYTIQSNDTPIEVSSDGIDIYTSSIFVDDDALISSLVVTNLDITHSYVGDLAATLTSPSGTVVQLFDRPGVPDSQFGCDNADLFVSFDDLATSTSADFENACDDTPAIGGVFQPIQSLSSFMNENPNGEWILEISDNADGDGGSINNWELDFCLISQPDYSLTASAPSFQNCAGDPYVFTIEIGNDFEATGVNLSAIGNPPGSDVAFSNNPAMPGETVTVTISNITTPGNYNVDLTADDGNNNGTTSISLVALSSPVPGSLNTPANTATGISLTPTLQWTAANNATNYIVEVATDNSFANIVASTNTTITTYVITSGLTYNTTYYWRIISENDCGANTSVPSSFTTEMDVAVDELEGNSFQLLPNPTTGYLDIIFAKAMNTELHLEIYSIDGSLLQQGVYINGLTRIPVVLDYADGVYVVRLVTAKAAVARRVVVQK